MKLGAAHPMGPLALADMIGLDVLLNVMDVLHEEFGDSKYRTHPLLRKYVRAVGTAVRQVKGSTTTASGHPQQRLAPASAGVIDGAIRYGLQPSEEHCGLPGRSASEVESSI